MGIPEGSCRDGNLDTARSISAVHIAGNTGSTQASSEQGHVALLNVVVAIEVGGRASRRVLHLGAGQARLQQTEVRLIRVAVAIEVARDGLRGATV